MQQTMKLGVLMAVLLMAVACKESAVEQWLARAEACMEVNADSAYRCLQYIEDTDEWDEGERARYALLRTQAMHKCRIPLEDDSLINTAVAYYADSRDRHRLALSLLYKGLVHKQCGEVEQAVEAFVGSEQVFEGVEDNQYKALLYSHYASLLGKQGMYESALAYYRKSYEYNLLGDSVHYVVTACGQIARMYKMLDMKDSAKVYYECGLLYKDDLCDGKERNYYLLLQNYAAFLIEGENYPEAEKLLQECLVEMKDSNYLHTLYSALSTLYYEKEDLDKALYYGHRILASEDSLTVCGGYLRLYKIYRAMGQMDSAYHFHNLYRQYDSDISLRLQTAKVAVIPHKMKSMQLEKENHALIGWKLWLAIALAVVVLVAIVIYIRIRQKHRFEQVEKDLELTEFQASLNETKHSLTKTQDELAATKVSLGQMKGMLAHQGDAVGRVNTVLEETKIKHQKEIDRLKESVKKLEAGIFRLREKVRGCKHTETELMQNFKMLKKQLKEKTGKLERVEHQREIDLRIDHFVMHGRDAIAVDMLLQFRYGKEVQARYDINPSEYLPMLRNLLEQENPALAERLNHCGLERKKLTLCYLIALGLDDVEMMSRAACLAPNSVRAYHKECRELVDGFRAASS